MMHSVFYLGWDPLGLRPAAERELQFTQMATGWSQRTSSDSSVPPWNPKRDIGLLDQTFPYSGPILVFPTTSLSF